MGWKLPLSLRAEGLHGEEPETLPCYSLLFLLVTERSPRTGSSRGAERLRENTGEKGGAPLQTLSKEGATLQSREDGDRRQLLRALSSLRLRAGDVKDLFV